LLVGDQTLRRRINFRLSGTTTARGTAQPEGCGTKTGLGDSRIQWQRQRRQAEAGRYKFEANCAVAQAR